MCHVQCFVLLCDWFVCVCVCVRVRQQVLMSVRQQKEGSAEGITDIMRDKLGGHLVEDLDLHVLLWQVTAGGNSLGS